MPRQILIINGSYRPNGVTDQTLALMADTLHAHDAQLRNHQLARLPD